MKVVVRRSAVKMWLMALGGIPLLVLSLDVLTNRRLTDRLREMLWRPENTQIFEPRDVIWAWAILLFSAFVILWGLKELFVPTKVIECRPEGLAVRLRGPFRKPNVIPWFQITDVDEVVVDDEGQKVKMLGIELFSRDEIPADPWGARWLTDDTLGVLAQDWAEAPSRVAGEISDYAVEQARNAPKEAVASIWRDDEPGGGHVDPQRVADADSEPRGGAHVAPASSLEDQAPAESPPDADIEPGDGAGRE